MSLEIVMAFFFKVFVAIVSFGLSVIFYWVKCTQKQLKDTYTKSETKEQIEFNLKPMRDTIAKNHEDTRVQMDRIGNSLEKLLAQGEQARDRVDKQDAILRDNICELKANMADIRARVNP